MPFQVWTSGFVYFVRFMTEIKPMCDLPKKKKPVCLVMGLAASRSGICEHDSNTL